MSVSLGSISHRVRFYCPGLFVHGQQQLCKSSYWRLLLGSHTIRSRMIIIIIYITSRAWHIIPSGIYLTSDPALTEPRLLHVVPGSKNIVSYLLVAFLFHVEEIHPLILFADIDGGLIADKPQSFMHVASSPLSKNEFKWKPTKGKMRKRNLRWFLNLYLRYCTIVSYFLLFSLKHTPSHLSALSSRYESG